MRLDLRGDDGLDAAADVEVTRHLHPSWFARRGKVIEDAVHRPLVEDAVVPEAPQIELETLQLETEPVGDVVDDNRSEIRRASRQLTQLSCVALDPAHRTERGELRALHADGVIALRIWILEGLEELWLRHRLYNGASGGMREAGGGGDG